MLKCKRSDARVDVLVLKQASLLSMHAQQSLSVHFLKCGSPKEWRSSYWHPSDDSVRSALVIKRLRRTRLSSRSIICAGTLRWCEKAKLVLVLALSRELWLGRYSSSAILRAM